MGQLKRRFSEDEFDPRMHLEEDLENDEYSLEEYGFQLGYYGEDE